jgi:hypothetical protein
MVLKKLMYEIGKRLLIIAVSFVKKSGYYPEKESMDYNDFYHGVRRLTGIIALYDDNFCSTNYQISIALISNPGESPMNQKLELRQNNNILPLNLTFKHKLYRLNSAN